MRPGRLACLRMGVLCRMYNIILHAHAHAHTEVAQVHDKSGTRGECRMARWLKSGWGSDRYGWFGTSGDTESEVHGVCVSGVIMYDRRMQACRVVRVSAEARMADACRRRGAYGRACCGSSSE